MLCYSNLLILPNLSLHIKSIQIPFHNNYIKWNLKDNIKEQANHFQTPTIFVNKSVKKPSFLTK